MVYICQLCGYEYDPKNGDLDNGIEPGTDFEDLDDAWGCPLCGAGKGDFEIVRSEDEEDDGE